MKKSMIVGLTSALLLVWTLFTSANAALVQFNSNLGNTWNEVFVLFPQAGTGSTATATLTFDYDTDINLVFNVHLSVQDLSIANLLTGNEIHVHPGYRTQVLIDVGGMGLVNAPGGIESSGNGSVVVSDLVETFLLSGKSWINIHTQTHPFGEIAGVVTPVPLPASFFLLLTGLVGQVGFSNFLRKAPKSSNF